MKRYNKPFKTSNLKTDWTFYFVRSGEAVCHSTKYRISSHIPRPGEYSLNSFLLSNINVPPGVKEIERTFGQHEKTVYSFGIVRKPGPKFLSERTTCKMSDDEKRRQTSLNV